jgi:aubergine-like protein
VVIIFPTLRDDRYAAVKRVLCSDIPCPSQCINAKTLKNEAKNRSIVQKILLQMNCKLGGALWGINIPLKNTMIIGIDTYHGSTDAKSGTSVGGLVASINSTFTHYFTKPHIQGKKEELVSGLTSCMIDAMQAYKTHNEGKLPDRLIIYRDGVGDGMLEQVRQVEINQFEEACFLVGQEYKPKITFLVVQKHVNMKFFKMLNKMKDGLPEVANPPPGSVLDNTVTRRHFYDFYLCAQHVREGTTTPSHYVVLRDDCNFDPDIMQKLTYKLT